MSLKEIMEKINNLQQEFKTEINKELDKSSKVKGVKYLGKGIMLISTKNFSVNNFSSEYYDTELQVRYIKEQLRLLTDTDKVKNKIESYITSRKIRVFREYEIELNENVLEVLKNIYAEF